MLVKHGLFLGGRRTGKIEREGGSFGGGGEVLSQGPLVH